MKIGKGLKRILSKYILWIVDCREWYERILTKKEGTTKMFSFLPF